MARSKAEICNLAISWLGGVPIFSLENDDSKEASLCRANYDMSRASVLEEREWTFALRRARLTPLLDDPVFGFSYAFQIPADSQKIIGVYTLSNQSRQVKHVIEDNHILCDESEIYVRYTVNLTNTKRFSALFDQALAAHLAANIALALNENAAIQQSMNVLYEVKLMKAITADGMQGTREKINTSQLTNSRRLFVRPQ